MVRRESQELEVRQRPHEIEGRTAAFAQGVEPGGVVGMVAWDDFGRATPDESAPGERLGVYVLLGEEHGGPAVGEEVPGVRGEAAQVDKERAAAIEDGGGDGGFGLALR